MIRIHAFRMRVWILHFEIFGFYPVYHRARYKRCARDGT